MSAAIASLEQTAAVPHAPTLRRRRARLAAWNAVATSIIFATSLVVIALWVAGGGIQGALGFDAESLNSLGRVTGLVSANLLLYQVLLMARVPVFERGFGRDGIVRMHRIVGMWSFWLLVAHIVLLSIGYAVQAGINPIAQLWSFVWDYPGMLLATAGTLLLVLVMVTSARRARRRTRYESWHLLHLYGYLGVGLAIPHMLWTGADFVGSPTATAYWWTLWGATAAAVLIFRVGRPIWRSLRHRIRVVAVEPDGAGAVLVRMRGRRIDRLGSRAGQFFVWRFLDGPGWMRGHPFSLAAAPSGDELAISVRIAGDGTRRIAGLRPGTRVLIEGPYGEMTADRRTARRMLMLGAGAGVAPLVSILEAEAFAPGEATILTRDHAPADRMRTRALGTLVEARGLRYFALDGHRAATGTSWVPASHSGWDGPDLLRRIEPRIEDCDVFLCGPDPWMRAVRADLRAAGVPAHRVHSERFVI